ncbi:MAG: thrombospondin type 3 repeat-containing protein, partial [Thermoplasmata archaeon]
MSTAFVLSVLLSSQQTTAKEYYAGFVPGSLEGKCEACHSGSSLDDFGIDFGAVPTHGSDPGGAIQSIANVDSDGDGFTNQEELSEGTYPGDSNSFPAAESSVDLPVIPLIGIVASLFLEA